jgi:prepilin-type N-terminal cleavage/methylation domain-containing protein
MERKGFTLIELLAVIIILGVIMLIAIPSVTKYIDNSKKNAYIDTAKELIKGATNLVNSGDLDMFDTDTTYYIPSTCISLETGGESPFGKFNPAYIIVTYNNNYYNYYWLSTDTANMGIKRVTLGKDLKEDLIETGVKDINTNIGIGERSKILVLNEEDCKSMSPDVVGEYVNENGVPINTFDENHRPVCIRVTSSNDLHSKECEKTTQGCYAAGYVEGNKGKTITYGNAKPFNSNLSPGDAFDCDVNNDNNYDPTNERFYVLSTSGSGTNQKVALIYSYNLYYGEPSLTFTCAYADKNSINALGYNVTQFDNWHGPAYAYKMIPSSSKWSNPNLLLPGKRTITTADGGSTTNNGEFTIVNPFDYGKKAGRLPTYQEVYAACGQGEELREGYMDSCNYLLDNINRYESGDSVDGYWLETPTAGNWNYARCTAAGYRTIGNCFGNVGFYTGVRPVIDVYASEIKY